MNPSTTRWNYRQGEDALAVGNMELALAHFNNAIDSDRAPEDLDVVADAYFALGQIALKRGDLALAGRQYLQCLYLAEQLAMPRVIASAALQLCIVSQRRNDLEQAEQFCRKAMNVAEMSGDQELSGVAYYESGLTTLQHGDLAQALEWFGKAREIFDRRRDAGRIAMVHLATGQTKYRQGLIVDAAKELEIAYETFYAAGDLNKARECLTLILNVSFSASDSHRLELAPILARRGLTG